MSTPHVWLSYDGTVDGNNVYTHALRVQNVNYPLLTGAVLQAYYNTDSSADGRLHRPRYQKLFDGNFLPGTVTQTNYYEYNGTGRVARTWSHGAAVDIERTMATATGVYGNWDRFGRTLQQRWFRGTTTHDQVDYTYDYAGNQLTRDIPSSLYAGNDQDQVYTYDGLQRLKNFDEGTLSGTSISGTPDREQDWSLDQLGNWPEFKQDNNGNGTWDLNQTRTHNAVNETGLSPAGGRGIAGAIGRGRTHGPWPADGPGAGRILDRARRAPCNRGKVSRPVAKCSNR